MKRKLISVILIAVMLISSIPFIVLADTITNDIDTDTTISLDDEIPEGAVVTLTKTLVINEGASLTVRGELKIGNGGSVIVYGELNIYGKITMMGGSPPETRANGVIRNAVTLPGSVPGQYTVFRMIYDPILMYYEEEEVGAQTTYLIEAGDEFAFKVNMVQPQHDPVTFPVKANGITVYNEAGYFKVLGIVDPIVFTFGDPQIKVFRIRLPKAEGYIVAARGMAGVPDSEVTDVVELKYGEDLEFTLRINENYDKSKNIKVYVNDVEVTADAYGYYRVPGIGTDGKSSYEINVMGVVSNQMTDTLKAVIDLFKSLYEAFQGIFEAFREIFSGFGGIFPTTTTTEPTSV